MIQYTLEFFSEGFGVPFMTLYGDLRDASYPKKLLTVLDGWDTPPIYSRITVPDPNGGNYADSVATPKGKIITLNWSIFHRDDSAAYYALEELKQLNDNFFTLKLTTLLSDGSKVVQTLTDCYIFNEPGVVKAPGEYKVTVSMESKDYDFTSNTLTPPVIEEPDPVDPPQPGEEGYTGTTDGEEGVGLQAGKVWNATTQTWDTPPVMGLYVGEPSTADTTVGTGFYWDGVTKTWISTDLSNVTSNPAYHDGGQYGEVGTESWNLGLGWEPRSTKWFNYPVSVKKLDTSGYELMYGNWIWALYKTLYVRGYYDAQNNTLTTTDLKAVPGYYDGTAHRQKGTESWNSLLWWNTNSVTAGWQNTDPGADLGPRDGSKGTYHGEFRARWTREDNVYWDSGLQGWGTMDPELDPMYVAGTEDKQVLQTPYAPIYWNININAYQSMTEFYNSRGEYPAPRSSVPGDYHGQEAVGEGLYWDSMNQFWSTTDWTKDPAYYAGIDDGNASPESFAFYLYWNESINYYQSEHEYYNTNGYFPFEKAYQ